MNFIPVYTGLLKIFLQDNISGVNFWLQNLFEIRFVEQPSLRLEDTYHVINIFAVSMPN